MNSTELIFYGGFLGIIVIIVILASLQTKANKERQEKVTIANEALLIAKQDLAFKRKALFQSITEIYGEDKAALIEEGGIYIGMPYSLLIIAKGLADNVKESFSRGSKIEKLYYGEHVNRLGNYNYTFEVTLSDEEVIGWKDLK